MPNTIRSFTGKYRFLSNFYPCKIYYEGIIYPSSEHAFQAAKTTDKQLKIVCSQLSSAADAKKWGSEESFRRRKMILRENWSYLRLQIMENILLIKFKEPALLRALVDTYPFPLIEGNNWGDSFWGVYMGSGANNLGKILMKIRKLLISSMRLHRK